METRMAAHAFWERGERPAYYPHPLANNHNEQTIQSAFGYGLDGSGFQKNKQNIIGTATTTTTTTTSPFDYPRSGGWGQPTIKPQQMELVPPQPGVPNNSQGASFPFYELRRQDFQRAHAVQEPQDQHQGSLLSPQSVFDFSSAMQRRVVPMTPTAPAPPPQAGPVRKRLNLLPRTKPVASQQPKGGSRQSSLYGSGRTREEVLRERGRAPPPPPPPREKNRNSKQAACGTTSSKNNNKGDNRWKKVDQGGTKTFAKLPKRRLRPVKQTKLAPQYKAEEEVEKTIVSNPFDKLA